MVVQWWLEGDSNNEGTQYTGGLKVIVIMKVLSTMVAEGDSNNEGTQYNGGLKVIVIMKVLSTMVT